MTTKIAINGLGRIGRCILRAFFEYNFAAKGLEIVAVNGPADVNQHIHLLKYDSSHGVFNKDVKAIGEDVIDIDGTKIRLFRERDVSNINWAECGVDIVLECTGAFVSRSQASLHLKSGAKKVIISAPAKEKDVKTIVYGVNHDILSKDDNVISIGSCTTNCLAPIAKVINDEFGIVNGFITTIHSYTGDQNVLDGSHSKGDMRRARSCGASMVPTSTGAAKAIGLVIPSLEGKMDGLAVRVPTQNVSLVDLSVNISKPADVKAINQAIKYASETSLKNVLGYQTLPLVSIDFNHDPRSSIFDSLETKMLGLNFVKVMSWYDNEWAFSVRMLDVAKIFN